MQRVTQAEKNKEKLKAQRDLQLMKKESQLNKLSDDEIITELKNKGLPTFGTKQEKLDRLKKFHGVLSQKNLMEEKEVNISSANQIGNNNPTPIINPPQSGNNISNNNNNNNANANLDIKKPMPKSNVVDNIEKLKLKRDERRQKMENMKKEKAEKEAEVMAMGKNIDVDFELMINKHRFKENVLQPHVSAAHLKLCICVRKRPIFKKEEVAGEIDSVSCANPQIKVLESKLKVDGITKYIEDHSFTFDNTFNENETSDDLYNYTLNPLIDLIFTGGVVTCFAYGQTGSGKTYTMVGIQDCVLNDIYSYAENKYSNLNVGFMVSFFEIYGGRCYDLLNNKNKLNILEDKNNNVQVQGLSERPSGSPQEMLSIIEYGNSVRTTHATVANDTSSRSHAICIVTLKTANGDLGKLILVDLAGSERAQDTQSNNRQRRLEGAEINKSLLALKECIRAMDNNANHIPFRASKLTLVLRDSFLSTHTNGRIVMIACICPGSTSADHTLNTLRYADRLKDRSGDNGKAKIVKNDFDLSEEENFDEGPKGKEIASNNVNVKPVEIPKNNQNAKIEIPANNNLGNFQSNNPVNNAKNNNQNVGNNAENVVKKNSKLINQERPLTENKQQNNKNVKAPIGQNPKKNSQEECKIVDKKNQKPQKPITKSDSSEEDKEDEKELGDPEVIKEKENKFKDDVKCMKETMKLDDKKMSNEFFDFHEKVNKILEDQEEIFSIHMAAIKEDAKLLTQESELISQVQNIGFMDYDIDSYVDKLELVLKKKFKIYNLLNRKLEKFKKHLKEEEEISSKVKNTFYY